MLRTFVPSSCIYSTVYRSAGSTNCDANANFNQGCGVQFSTPASYGSAFNAAGGGFFVLVRSRAFSPGVSIWFWARDDPRVPLEVRSILVHLELDLRKPAE